MKTITREQMEAATGMTHRKPVQLELVGGKSKRQRIWEVLRTAHGWITYDQLSRILPTIEIDTMRSYLQGLVAANILQRREKPAENGRKGNTGKNGQFMPHLSFRVIDDRGALAPRVDRHGKAVRQGNGNLALWRAMRVQKVFTAYQLANLASLPGYPISMTTASTYCQVLARAGYLRVTKPGIGKRLNCVAVLTQYEFIEAKWSGPRAPMIQRTKAVYDPNKNAIVWQQPPAEVIAEALEDE